MPRNLPTRSQPECVRLSQATVRNGAAGTPSDYALHR